MATWPAKRPLRAGLPTSVSGMSMDRQCASGLMAIATAAKEIIVDNMDVAVAGGLESISLVQEPDKMNTFPRCRSVVERKPPGHLHVHAGKPPKLSQTVITCPVTARTNTAFQSQMRTAAAQEAGKFDDEIAPMTSVMKVMNKETKANFRRGSDPGQR